jgi:alpha-glucosidase
VLLLLYALRGTPFVYQGEELGLPDAEIPPERVVDVDGRDPERAPMPWRPPSVAGPGAGFTTGEPWLPVVADAEGLAADTQAADPRSTLALARRLAALRRETPALQTGAQRTVDLGADVLAWTRGEGLLCAVNFAAAPVAIDVPGTLVLSTDPDRAAGGAVRELRPGEGVIVTR